MEKMDVESSSDESTSDPKGSESKMTEVGNGDGSDSNFYTIEELKVLAWGLNSFGNEKPRIKVSLFTILIKPDDHLSRFMELLDKELNVLKEKANNIAVEYNAYDKFNQDSLVWVMKQFEKEKIKVGRNGLALFAGARERLETDKENGKNEDSLISVSKVWIAVEPEYKINTSSFAWDSKFQPELMMKNVAVKKNWAFVIICKAKAIVALYNEESLNARYIELDINIDQFTTHELPRIKEMTNELFLRENSNVPCVIGVILGVCKNVNIPAPQNAINPEELLAECLINLSGVSVKIPEGGLPGLHYTVERTTGFREKSALDYQENYIKNIKNDNGDKEVDSEPFCFLTLEEALNDIGAGKMEITTRSKIEGFATKFTLKNFGHKRRLRFSNRD